MPRLEPNAIGFRESLAVGLASTAPAYSLAAVIGTVTVVVGFQAPGAMLASFVPMFLIAGAFFYMNRADQDAGTTFSWVTRALGPWLGWLGGWAVITTGILVVGSLADVGARYTYELVGWESAAASKTAVMVLAVAYIVVMTAICIIGTELTGAIQDVLIVLQVGALLLFAGAALYKVYDGTAPAALVEARARLVLALCHLEHLDSRLCAAHRGLHLLGLGERREPDGGDARLRAGARPRRRRSRR